MSNKNWIKERGLSPSVVAALAMGKLTLYVSYHRSFDRQLLMFKTRIERIFIAIKHCLPSKFNCVRDRFRDNYAL